MSPPFSLNKYTQQMQWLLLWMTLHFTALHAVVDDSHSLAMGAATPFVQQGFLVREDYWSGEIKNNTEKMIKHQMFKGNEYAFWLASSLENVSLELKIIDERGQIISFDFKNHTQACSVRINPPRSGTYTIVYRLTSSTDSSIPWALAYGYR
jgi:hypothetical protein